MRRAGLVVSCVVFVLSACGSGGSAAPLSQSTSGSSSSIQPNPSQAGGTPSATTPLSDVHVQLRKIASLDGALALAVRRGDPALYVAQQGGTVMAIRDGRVDPSPVLDLRGQISSGGEQGLLGLAFSPDGRYLYVNYTDLEGNTNVVEFAMGSNGRADVGTRREILYVKQPFANHNGGNLVFGPDGDLYIGLGDGGSGGDPLGNGQSLSTLLGKMLRVEPRLPDGSVPPNGADAIPTDNPFQGRTGTRPEIWAYGLRNPWRYSFDKATGDLWIGDVGQSDWEEIDVQAMSSHGGQNYGWNRLEGSHPYQGQAPADAVGPVYEYSHDQGGCAVTGGYVYRGTDIPGLAGAYLFADFCVGDVMALRVRDGRAAGVTKLGVHVDSLASFGEDAAGELYVLSLASGVYRLEPAG